MTVQEAVERFKPPLIRDSDGRYRFPCRKVVLMVRLLGARDSLKFKGQDRIGFRIDDSGLTVEDLRTGAVRKRFSWAQVESVTVGEPETDSGLLFQG